RSLSHPHAGRLGWLSAAQGLRDGHHSGAVQRRLPRGGTTACSAGSHTMTTDATERAALIQQTSEGSQELKPRRELTANELMREVGSVLRISEAEAAKLGEYTPDVSEDQTMIINMGPQHPSTHGVLRLMLELRGETVLRCKPIVGYLHTGMEKTGETLTYMQ